MASTNEEFWTSETLNLLVDRRIARDPLFRTSNSDQIGWLEVLADLRKIVGTPQSLNRIHVRRQWTKICEEFKKYSEIEGVNEIHFEDYNFPYFTKLKTFFDTAQQQRIKALSEEEDCKAVSAVLLKTTNYFTTQIYEDRWSTSRTELLIDSRIGKNYLFKGRGHSGLAWQAVLSDMIDKGEPDTLTVSRIRKKWENLYTKYQNVKKCKTSPSTPWPHFVKLDEFFLSRNNDVNGLKSLQIAEKPQDGNNEFSFCVSSDNTLFECEMDVEEIDKFVEREESSPKEEEQPNTRSRKVNFRNQNDGLVYAERWSEDRTKLLVKSKIARDSMFDGRKLSTSGWKALLKDLRNRGMPHHISLVQIKKKWGNLCRKYKLLKNDKELAKSWPFFKEMHAYFETRKEEKLDLTENCHSQLSDNSDVMTDLKKHQEEVLKKLENCRLCQEDKIECVLIDDKDLCEKISVCLTLNILEHLDILPSGICAKCKEKIENFYHFYLHCHENDKQLRDAILPLQQIKIEGSRGDSDQDILNNLTSFDCSECPVSCNSNEALEIHLKSHDKNPSRFFCEVCNSSFSRQSTLYAHIKRHFDVNNVKIISEGSNSKSVEENSEEIVENDESLIENENSECFDETFDNHESQETEDDQQNIQNIIVYSCELCNKTFDNKRDLKDHLQTHSKTMLKCPREGCGKTYMSIKSLHNHELKHSGVYSYLCVVCGKGFSTNNVLRVHEKIHLEVKEHSCDICNIRFSVQSNLRAHQKRHHEGHRFYCSQCPKEFFTKSSLKRHEIVHTGVKEFICDVCSAAFYTAKELKKHKIYHDGTRLHHCNVCFKTFFEKHHLTVHMRSHTDERPYPCKVLGCGKSFRESQKLSRHMKQQHSYKAALS